jgi:hypothetical protein
MVGQAFSLAFSLPKMEHMLCSILEFLHFSQAAAA